MRGFCGQRKTDAYAWAIADAYAWVLWATQNGRICVGRDRRKTDAYAWAAADAKKFKKKIK